MVSSITNTSKPKFLKPAILSLSILTVLSGMAVSPALGQIQLAFPDASELAIQMVLTLPPLLIIPVGLISGRLAGRMSKRAIVLTGMVIYLLAGVGGGFMNSMAMLLVSRALLGVGTGLIAPLSLSLIADFYDGDERSTTMGQSSAIATMGGIFLPLISGWLSVFSWRYAFAAYLIAIAVFVLVWFFLPEPDVVQEKQGGSGKLPAGVFGLGILTVLLMVVFYLLPTKIALFIQEIGIGDSRQSGLVIGTLNLAAFLIGMSFGKLRNYLKEFTPLFSISLMTLGLILIYISGSIALMSVGMFLCGLGIGSLMPLLFLLTANLVPDSLNASALSITNSSLYFGQFVSPLVFTVIASVFQRTDIRFDFLAGAVLTGFAAVVLIVVLVFRKR